jgi:hypothetical protein
LSFHLQNYSTKPGDHGAVIEGFMQPQGAAVAGGALAVEFNANGPIAGGSPNG